MRVERIDIRAAGYAGFVAQNIADDTPRRPTPVPIVWMFQSDNNSFLFIHLSMRVSDHYVQWEHSFSTQSLGAN